MFTLIEALLSQPRPLLRHSTKGRIPHAILDLRGSLLLVCLVSTRLDSFLGNLKNLGVRPVQSD